MAKTVKPAPGAMWRGGSVTILESCNSSSHDTKMVPNLQSYRTPWPDWVFPIAWLELRTNKWQFAKFQWERNGPGPISNEINHIYIYTNQNHHACQLGIAYEMVLPLCLHSKMKNTQFKIYESWYKLQCKINSNHQSKSSRKAFLIIISILQTL